MKWMVRNALVMADSGKQAQEQDIIIDGDRILAMGRGLDGEAYGVEKIDDAVGKLIVPGLVNAHLHSHDRFDKGRFGTMPLEVWISLYNPPTISREWTPRECYLRTMLSGLDLLRSGTTTVIDDVHHGIPASPENIEAVFQAYEDLGIRAQVSVAHCDKPFWDGVPYLNEILPDELKRRHDKHSAPSSEFILSYWRELAEKWHDRVQFVLSPSGPQRCSDFFLEETWALSQQYDLPVVVHVLETRIQKMSGDHYYGKSIVTHMNELGLLTPRANLVHGVWMSDADLDLVAEGGACVVHCPGSNLKLGSGVAPVKKMLERGIPVGLGTDNHNANDSANIFETVKLAGLLGAVKQEYADGWLSSAEVLTMATQGGAQCAGLNERIGTLEVGKKADFVMLDLKQPAFTPLNDVANQLVYCDSAGAIDMVVVDGRVVLENGKATAFDEDQILAEFRERSAEIMGKIAATWKVGTELQPHLSAAYRKCRQQIAASESGSCLLTNGDYKMSTAV